jgi:hypothetical protein
MRYGAIGNSLIQVPFVKDGNRSVLGKFMHQDLLRYEMTFWARISKDTNKYGELFFRPRFTYLRRDPSQSYLQVQLGYQFDVFSNRRAATPVLPLF